MWKKMCVKKIDPIFYLKCTLLVNVASLHPNHRHTLSFSFNSLWDLQRKITHAVLVNITSPLLICCCYGPIIFINQPVLHFSSIINAISEPFNNCRLYNNKSIPYWCCRSFVWEKRAGVQMRLWYIFSWTVELWTSRFKWCKSSNYIVQRLELESSSQMLNIWYFLYKLDDTSFRIAERIN